MDDHKYQNLKKILVKLIIRPKKIFMDDEIIHYSPKLLNILYYVSYIIIGGVFTFQSFINFKYSLTMILIATIVYITIDAILIKELTVLGYYIVFRWIGKIYIDYKELRTIFFPIIFISSVAIIILKEAFHNLPLIANILDLSIDLWFNYIVILFLRNRLKQSFQNTILIIILPVLFNIGLFIWMFLK